MEVSLIKNETKLIPKAESQIGMSLFYFYYLTYQVLRVNQKNNSVKYDFIKVFLYIKTLVF